MMATRAPSTSAVEWMHTLIKDNFCTLRFGNAMRYRLRMNQATYDREIAPALTAEGAWGQTLATRFSRSVEVQIDPSLADGQAELCMEIPEGGLRWR